MYYYYFLLIIISLIYILIILFFTIGWIRIKVFQKGIDCPSEIFISLIIALRNEEKNIPGLINSISNQTLDFKQFELILVNDHSTDKTAELIQKYAKKLPNANYTESNECVGKKHAITQGIRQAKGELIVTTDADCIHHPDWLKTIHDFYNLKKPKLIVGPVLMSGKSLFENIQSIDFFSLIVSGAGASGLNRPIMCNGANLAYSKDLFSEINPLRTEIASGDDIFLLHYTKKKYPGQISFLKSVDATVISGTEHTFLKFLEQRRRWASKAKYYTDFDTTGTALSVFLINLSLLFNLILSIYDSNFLLAFMIQFTIKSLFDFILLYKGLVFYNNKQLLYYFIPAQIFNIFMIPFVAISGMTRKIQWKGLINN